MNRTTLGALALIAATATIGLGGCVRHHGHMRAARPLIVADRLDCPDVQGTLTRVSAAADGSRCEYRRGDNVQLSLIRMPLNGQTPQAALAGLDAELRPLLPPLQTGASASTGDHDGDSNDKDSAHIDVPGVHIDAHGDKAEVRVFGVTVDADKDKANVNAGLGSNKASVSADQHGAEVRAAEVNATNANVVMILASEKPGPSGLRAVGYIARGPVSGPLLVAQFKSTEQHQGFNDDHDVRRLMDRNLSR